MLQAKKKYKILIVDDSRFNRLVMTSMLANDYLIEEAVDGKQAMLILQDRIEEFSLVLLDIVMPNMDGFELLKVMKECGWIDFLPVIMISSEYTPDNVEMSYHLGASDLIRRPYDESIVCHRIANTIALSSKNRKLSNALVDEVIKENKSNEAMVSILSHIVETRNGESGAHVQNIRYITGMLLNELMKRSDEYALSKEEIFQIITASSLHDIGKISVPEEILNKPGKLTDEEFQVIKGHAMAGANMLEPLCQKADADPLIRTAYEICRWHHERYDGRGYPDGLKGSEIPISAQVVAMADVYDALTSERCYKAAYSSEKAMQMIRSGQCGAFDPLLLDCLSGELGRIKEASSVSRDIVLGDYMDSNQMLAANALVHSHENGLFSSGKIMETLERDRLRFKFFFNEPCIAFYYTVSPSVLHFNKVGREFLGMEGPIVEPEKKLGLHEGYDRPAAERLKGKLAAATNENPLVKDDILLCLPGETPQRYQCVMQTIWDSADARHYEEIVGRLLPTGDETYEISVAEEIGDFSAADNAVTRKGAWYLINALRFMVYNVRLVDPSDGRVVELDSNGNFSKSDHHCYETWKQDQRCENCTSAKCLRFQKRFSKIVFFDGEVFYVVSQYIKIDGIPLVLEMLTRITEDAMIDRSGKKLPISSISDLNNKLYLDPLTNVYNRRYYNTKADNLENICALAMIDVDNFKCINDTYGHNVGDNVLERIAETIGSDIRPSDVLMRYGGDEFVIMFESIATGVFKSRLKKMCEDVSALSIDGIEKGQHVTISIGGAVGPDVPAVLMRKADQMLYKAKNNKGTVEICS